MQHDQHYLMLCRYVERNGLAWCSAWARRRPKDATTQLLGEWPIPRPANWVRLLNERPDEVEAMAIQASVDRCRPLGMSGWVSAVAGRLKLGHTLRPPGRPRRLGRTPPLAETPAA